MYYYDYQYRPLQVRESAVQHRTEAKEKKDGSSQTYVLSTGSIWCYNNVGVMASLYWGLYYVQSGLVCVLW